MQLPKLMHFTEGGPWHGHTDQEGVNLWQAELESLLCGANPCARGMMEAHDDIFSIEVKYEQTT